MIVAFVHALGAALLASVSMAWRVAWSLVLGFALSGLVQAVVPRERTQARFGGDRPRQIALAALLGAASSSCSYAAASLSRTLFRRGASFAVALAFLFASTNLVLKLGVILPR